MHIFHVIYCNENIISSLTFFINFCSCLCVGLPHHILTHGGTIHIRPMGQVRSRGDIEILTDDALLAVFSFLNILEKGRAAR